MALEVIGAARAPVSVRSALVTLWKAPNSSAQADFVCSGVFVAPACVLTAAHAIDDAKTLWVSAFGTPNSSPVIRSERHDRLDVALLSIESVPTDAGVLACDRRKQVALLPRPLTLNGSFEGRAEAPQTVTVLNFSPEDRHYLIEPKQPRGQSGSPVCTAEGAVWAIAVRHYADANTQRGGVIAVHQFADWMDPRLDPMPGSQPTSLPRDEGLPANDTTPRRTEAAYASIGLAEVDEPFIVSACIVSDAPQRLRGELADMRARAVDDPLTSSAVRQRVRKADLAALLQEASLRPRLLERLAVTSFSAYVHYASKEEAGALSVDERRRRWLVELLAQRLRKRSEQIAVVYADDVALGDLLIRAAAVGAGDRIGAREAPRAMPADGVDGRPLVELARLVALAVARHLAAPQDDDATTLFEYLRTRIRFALNVVTQERHTRDVDPLP